MSKLLEVHLDSKQKIYFFQLINQKNYDKTNKTFLSKMWQLVKLWFEVLLNRYHCVTKIRISFPMNFQEMEWKLEMRDLTDSKEAQ